METGIGALGYRVVRWAKIGWLFFWAGFATTLVFVPVLLSAWLDRNQRSLNLIYHFWAGLLLAVTGVKTSSRGREKIDRERSYVIVSNHQSHFDILALMNELPVPIRWVMKKELGKIPVFGPATRAMRNIFIDRSNTAEAVRNLREGVRRLPPACSLMFFPEGTRSPDGKIGPFKKGAFRTAKAVDWPILPVVVRGSRQVLPKGELMFRSNPIEVEILDPIDEEEVRKAEVEEMMERVRTLIVERFEEK